MRGLVLFALAALSFAEEPLAARTGKAIDRGVAFLRTKQREDGSWGAMGSRNQVNYEGRSGAYVFPAGPTALSLLTMLKCGVEPTDEAIERGFDYLRKNYRHPKSAYEISCLMLAIEARANPYKRDRKREADLKKAHAKSNQVKLGGADRKWMRSLLKKLEDRETEGGFRYGGGIPHPHGFARDISSTHRCGVKPSHKLVKRAIRFCLDAQERSGGWAYSKESPTHAETVATGTMTTGGIVILLVGRDILGKLDAKTEQKVNAAVERGLGWIRENWTVEKNPAPHKAHYHLMYLYGLERVGDLLRVALIGEHDWYREGAEWLLGNQRGNGSWTGRTHPPRDVLNTCFALLFLDRATLHAITPRGEK